MSMRYRTQFENEFTESDIRRVKSKAVLSGVCGLASTGVATVGYLLDNDLVGGLGTLGMLTGYGGAGLLGLSAHYRTGLDEILGLR